LTPPSSGCRYVILGSGVAGIAAAQAIRSIDHTGPVSIISEDPFGYYSRPGLAYYLTGELGEDLLFPISKKDFRGLNLQWHASQAGQILPAERRVVLNNRFSVPYDRLLIATGSLAAPLTSPGKDLSGVFKLDNLTDAKAILQHTHRSKAAVVVGGGITALELVEGLRAQRLDVHFFLRGDRYWGNVLDETESEIIRERLEEEGVHLHFKTELAEIEGSRGRVAAVITKDHQRIPCDTVCFAIGTLPRKELAVAAGLVCDRGILANEYLQSSDESIYAAGDIAQVFDPFSGKTGIDTLWSTARHQGHVAGLNMAGNPTLYQKSVPLNVTRLAGLTTTIIGTVGKGLDPSLTGLARGDSETWRMLPEHMVAETRKDGNRLRLLVGERHLLGALILGDQTLSIPLQQIIGEKADITPIRDRLLTFTGLTETVTHFWETWRSHYALS
jgi:NAD(P)H-nitrite reductase large subunit